MDKEIMEKIISMNDGTNMEKVVLSGGQLWGQAGGELEFVSMRVGWRKRSEDKYERIVILRFTDHDVQACRGIEYNGGAPIDKLYYEIEMPFSDMD